MKSERLGYRIAAVIGQLTWPWILGGVVVLGAIYAISNPLAARLAGAADLDTLREPIVRPSTDTLKQWLYGQEIALEKRARWFNRREKLDPGKWTKLSAQGGSVVAKAVGTNIATSIWSFEYPDGRGATNQYVVAVEYEWSVKLGRIDRVFLKAIITGP